MTVLLVVADEGFGFRGTPEFDCAFAWLSDFGGKVVTTFSDTLSAILDEFSICFNALSTSCEEVVSETFFVVMIWGGVMLNLAERSTFFLFDSAAFFLNTRNVGFLAEDVAAVLGLETKLTIGVLSEK